jgi:hypothetical protein
MSTPRVTSSAPWMTRAKAPDHDVEDVVAVERREHPARVELGLSHGPLPWWVCSSELAPP